MDKNEEAVAVFDKYAIEYGEKYMDVSLYHHALDHFCSNLPHQDSAVLELASGPGNITKYVLDKNPQLRITGSDLAPNMIELASKNNPGANFVLLDARSISELKEKYDGIICGFIFPFFSGSEVEIFINKVVSVLNERGLLYISTMEQDKNTSGYEAGSHGDLVYINYHEGPDLIGYLVAAGFEVIFEDRVSYKLREDKMITDVLLIARKK